MLNYELPQYVSNEKHSRHSSVRNSWFAMCLNRLWNHTYVSAKHISAQLFLRNILVISPIVRMVPWCMIKNFLFLTVTPVSWSCHNALDDYSHDTQLPVLLCHSISNILHDWKQLLLYYVETYCCQTDHWPE